MSSMDDFSGDSSSSDEEDISNSEVTSLVNSAKKVRPLFYFVSDGCSVYFPTEETCQLASGQACKGTELNIIMGA